MKKLEQQSTKGFGGAKRFEESQTDTKELLYPNVDSALSNMHAMKSVWKKPVAKSKLREADALTEKSAVT